MTTPLVLKLGGELLETDEVARMSRLSRRDRIRPLGEVGEVPDSGRADDRVRDDLLTIGHPGH